MKLTDLDQDAFEARAFDLLLDRLVTAFAGQYTPEEIAEAVERERLRYAAVPIREFVPLLVERTVRKAMANRPAPTPASS